MAYPNGAIFTTPVVYRTPPFTVDDEEKGNAAYRLRRHGNNLPYSLYVFEMSDGTFTQSEVSPENSNTAIPPYPPFSVDWEGASFPQNSLGNAIAWTHYFTQATGYVDLLSTFTPYPLAVFFAGKYTVSSVLANALANYTAHGTGYASDLVAL